MLTFVYPTEVNREDVQSFYAEFEQQGQDLHRVWQAQRLCHMADQYPQPYYDHRSAGRFCAESAGTLHCSASKHVNKDMLCFSSGIAWGLFLFTAGSTFVVSMLYLTQ